jgi:TatD DNase family protein
MLIDTHIHLDAREFDADRAALIEAARGAGVGGFVVPATGVGNFDAVAALSQTHDFLWHAYGIHPLYIGQAGSGDLALLDHRLAQGDAVAVGEIGLDLYVANADFERQLHFFQAQLQLARRHQLPVIVHARRAVEAVLQALRCNPVAGGIIHAFNGSPQQAAAFIALGFKLGFGGAMSYAGSTRIRRLATELPLAAIVLETDAPDMAPEWARAQRNLPANLPRLAAILAELRALPLEEIVDATTRNARAALPGLDRR